MSRVPSPRLIGMALAGAATCAFARAALAVVTLPIAAPVACRVSFVSGNDWTVYAADPAVPGAIAGAPLGLLKPICLARWSRGCPPGAIAYGHPRRTPGRRTPIRSWVARGCWAPGVTPDAPGDLARYVFVRSIDLPHVGSAWLRLAADDFAEVRVNGTRVGAIGSVHDIAAAAAAHCVSRDLRSRAVSRGRQEHDQHHRADGPSSYVGCAGGLPLPAEPGGRVVRRQRRRLRPAAAVGTVARRPRHRAPARLHQRRRQLSAGSAHRPRPVVLRVGDRARRPVRVVRSVDEKAAGLTDGDGLAYLTPPGATHPVAFFNPTDAVRYPGGTLALQPGQLALHPGPAGEYAIARWQASDPGRVAVTAEFVGLSSHPPYPATTTDVHVRRGGGALASGTLNLGGTGNTFRYTATLDVAARDDRFRGRLRQRRVRARQHGRRSDRLPLLNPVARRLRGEPARQMRGCRKQMRYRRFIGNLAIES